MKKLVRESLSDYLESPTWEEIEKKLKSYDEWFTAHSSDFPKAAAKNLGEFLQENEIESIIYKNPHGIYVLSENSKKSKELYFNKFLTYRYNFFKDLHPKYIYWKDKNIERPDKSILLYPEPDMKSYIKKLWNLFLEGIENDNNYKIIDVNNRGNDYGAVIHNQENDNIISFILHKNQMAISFPNIRFEEHYNAKRQGLTSFDKTFFNKYLGKKYWEENIKPKISKYDLSNF